MGFTETSIWISIRYYDSQEPNNENLKTSLHQVTLPSVKTFEELKSILHFWANVQDDGMKVIKLRNYDNSLIPYSALFQGSSKEKPFIIDVIRIHQFCESKKRIIPPGYMNTMKSTLIDLEKRVIKAENLIPEMTSIHVKAVEVMANRLINCVSYLDRRLDDLTPANWKSQLTFSI